MDKKPPDILIKLAREAIDLAIECVSTGETLIPFIMTEGAEGAIITIVGESIEKSNKIAREKIHEFDKGTDAFAFAYDGFLTLKGDRADAIFVEVGERTDNKIFVFTQRYKYQKNSNSLQRIGNWECLETMKSRLENNAEQASAPNAKSRGV